MQGVYAAHGAHLFVERAVDHQRGPRLHNGSGAHRAGLQRDVERAAGQRPVPQLFSGAAQCQDFRMGGDIAAFLALIARLRKNLPVPHHQRTHGDFTRLCCFPCEIQRNAHKTLVFLQSRHDLSAPFLWLLSL